MHRVGLLLIALGAVTAPLGAQADTASQAKLVPTHALGFGLVATLGANWQIESMEFGYVHRPNRGFAAVGLAARLGTFVNESTMLGANQGVVFSGTLSARTHMKSIAQLGDEEHGTGIGFDLTLELSGYLAAHSPLPLGSRWAGVSILPAFSIGSGSSAHFGLVIGPTMFLHQGKPMMRGLLALRGEAPLARRERHP